MAPQKTEHQLLLPSMLVILPIHQWKEKESDGGKCESKYRLWRSEY